MHHINDIGFFDVFDSEELLCNCFTLDFDNDLVFDYIDRFHFGGVSIRRGTDLSKVKSLKFDYFENEIEILNDVVFPANCAFVYVVSKSPFEIKGNYIEVRCRVCGEKFNYVNINKCLSCGEDLSFLNGCLTKAYFLYKSGFVNRYEALFIIPKFVTFSIESDSKRKMFAFTEYSISLFDDIRLANLIGWFGKELKNEV